MMNYSFYKCQGITTFKKFQEQSGKRNGSFTFQSNYMSNCRNFFSNKLFSHFGCVNAVEFSNNTRELLASGGDDKRVLLWNVGQSLLHKNYKPVVMIGTHVSNIFCIAFNSGNDKLLSSGNDEQVLVHDVHTKQVINVYLREDAVYSISAHPNDPFIFVTASEDGKLRITDTRQPSATTSCLANYVSAFHGVAFNPMDPLFVAGAHSKEGAALWDTRKPKSTVLCYGAPLSRESTMSVQFSADGSRLLVLRRKKCPRVYKTHSNIPFVEGKADGYLNSCTMKSGCFAGLKDEYFVSGSDDFNVYVWKIPELSSEDLCVKIESPRMVLHGHRSIVNQVRYNKESHVLVSSGVEKHLNLWSPFHYPHFQGQVEESSPEQGRQLYSRHQYIDLVLRSGTTLTHDYESENTYEDPRMIAFFDSLLQHDQNHSSNESDSSIDDDDRITNFRLLPALMSATRPDGLESTTTSSASSDSSSSDDTIPLIPDVTPTTFTIERDSRLQRLRQSLRSSDDDAVAETSRVDTPERATSPQSRDGMHDAAVGCSNSGFVATTTRKRSSSSSDESVGDRRHSAMRKRNAVRRSATKRSKESASTSKRQSPGAEQNSSDSSAKRPNDLTTADAGDCAFKRSFHKLNRSIEETNLKLAGLADQMAAAMEEAGKNNDSSGSSLSDDNLSSKDDKL